MPEKPRIKVVSIGLGKRRQTTPDVNISDVISDKASLGLNFV